VKRICAGEQGGVGPSMHDASDLRCPSDCRTVWSWRAESRRSCATSRPQALLQYFDAHRAARTQACRAQGSECGPQTSSPLHAFPPHSRPFSASTVTDGQTLGLNQASGLRRIVNCDSPTNLYREKYPFSHLSCSSSMPIGKPLLASA
jgi:hypothetical protein